ncbi:helix-turn-helix transcriptional regulator [Streptomyces cavernicola]|uniref:LuxR C-terminal-related transcriptional regulator n=1 Tax=Streptomyces cavernicola TaxID=3043613 RepID=A0ABT6S7S9_9ACTN|nr:LuxR C-terminal-related transcriptional regulator [Streptomyces sp. B-S-A6]MDI3404151.1 LuxR C-terminal-related transcriptional regulator [Streptomyces sp. B-S-A6]
MLLSIRALTERVRHLRPLWSCCCTRLVLLAGSRDRDRLDRARLQVAAELPIDAVLREEDLSDGSFAETLDALGRGTVSVSRNTMRELFALAADAGPQGPHTRFELTARELTVLELMMPGLSNRQIAKTLGITEHGVKRHVANILVKLGCQNRTMAVASGIRLGLVNLESVPSAM